MSFSEYPYNDYANFNLDWIINKMKDLIKRVSDIETSDIERDKILNEINSYYEKIKNGNFPEEVKNAFAKWMRENANDLVGQMVKNVYFGLNDDGYFVAFIPDSWKDVVFNTTGLDITVALMPEYGHLILSY